jgi:hypothetical protein
MKAYTTPTTSTKLEIIALALHKNIVSPGFSEAKITLHQNFENSHHQNFGYIICDYNDPTSQLKRAIIAHCLTKASQEHHKSNNCPSHSSALPPLSWLPVREISTTHVQQGRLNSS